MDMAIVAPALGRGSGAYQATRQMNRFALTFRLPIIVWPTVAYFVVQLLEGWLLTPWIESKSMQMSAVAILIVVLLGGAIGGLYGLLLAIPLAVRPHLVR